MSVWIYFCFTLSTLIVSRIACISAPTAYRKIKELKPDTCEVICLEFDERFKVFGQDFIFYDYKEPLKLAPELKMQFDIVIADPPFLSEDCLTKMALSMKYLSKKKLILCTGKNFFYNFIIIFDYCIFLILFWI